MKIKITAKNKHQLRENIKNVMDTTLTIVSGSIPSVYNMTREDKGRYWTKEGDTYEIFQVTNNNKYFIRDEGEGFVVLEFFYRYDKDYIKKPDDFRINE